MFLRFCLVGCVGFAVDSGLLLLLTTLTVVGPLLGRALSFVTAALVTWALNRRFTFGSGAARSVAPYVLFTSVGALINLGVYRFCIHLLGEEPAMLVVGVATGSIAALAFNFLVSKHVVFRVKSTDGEMSS